MRPPRLILFIFCVIFLPIFYTFFSALFSSPRVSTPNALAGRTTGLHALFSFNLPSSLFPPSAIISLTDDNSTFFLARPAAFGPSLAKEGLSGQLWVGSGFGEGGLVSGVEGELGCSDIPGWGDGGDAHYKQEKPYGKSVSGTGKGAATVSQNRHPQQESDSQNIANSGTSPPSKNDGTDDHLHHPLLESDMVNARGISETSRDYAPTRPGTHADVQSLQEGAEISGKVVLLSRGGCGFLEKVKWAQRRGGVAVIVGDNTRGGSLVTMYARVDTSNVTIPALFTSHTTAHLLSSLIPSQLSEEASRVEESKASRTKTSSQSTSSKFVDLMTTPSATPTPTLISNPAVDSPPNYSPKPKTGLFYSLLSLIGLGSTSGHSWHPPEDSRRPPSSGNIDWVVMNSWDQVESSDHGRGGRAKSSDTKRYGPKMSGNADGDGFVIGVQDWRDPDLAPTRRSAFSSSNTAVGQETQKTQTRASETTPTGLKGGSVTPGSGEYVDVEENSYKSDWSFKNARHQSSTADTQPGSRASGKGWFSRHFGRASAEKHSSDSDSDSPDLRERSYSVQEKQNTQDNSHSRNRQAIKPKDHEGLWVTLTPTSMSTSPFFDTLLVLVVSPLLTLSVVYALLLIRSRVRRRRWRAPKSVVDRLPIRTYHTISASSSVASSPRSSIHDSSSPDSPLLSTDPESPPSRPQSPVTSGSAPGQRRQRSKAEKSRSGSRLWRRRYTGRQVECVVCLEEYIDGQSRVMSLPCGHEFHAECITPWLTTRRRTCPICKGDVVRSISSNASEPREQTGPADERTHELESQVSSAPVVIASPSEDEMSDTEHHAESYTGLLEQHASSAPASGWRNFASLSLSALSGDTIWRQVRPDRNR